MAETDAYRIMTDEVSFFITWHEGLLTPHRWMEARVIAGAIDEISVVSFMNLWPE
jgi:hypothetical protein